jgi:hypothetical protein
MLHPDSRQSEGNAWTVAWFAAGSNDPSSPINEKNSPVGTGLARFPGSRELGADPMRHWQLLGFRRRRFLAQDAFLFQGHLGVLLVLGEYLHGANSGIVIGSATNAQADR